MLDVLDELGIADNTFVMYSTDNGPHMNTWPDGGDDAVPQREEHELGGRLPRAGPGALAGQGPAGVVIQRDRQHHDWLPTFLAMAGEPDIIGEAEKGHKAGDKTFKVHIDGYNLLPLPDREGNEESA